MAKANKAYVYRLYPTTEQRDLLAKTFGCCRKVYNEILAYNNSRHDEGEKMLSKTAANNRCNRVLKDTYPYLREADKFALTNAIYALYNGYDRFFKKTAGFPKFKSKRKARNSYTTNITGNNIAVLDNAVKLPKLKLVKAKIHRHAPSDWQLKSATVSMDRDGKYYISVLYEYEMTKLATPVNPQNSVGLDYKPSELYVDSNSDHAGMPKYTKKYAIRLAMEQQRLSRKQGSRKGEACSCNFIKQQRRVARIHKKIANSRKDFLHKTSSAITKQYDVICIQDESIREKIASRQYGNYRKSVYDCGWNMFTQMLSYKQEALGHQLVVVDKNIPSTQICHVCGHKHHALTDDGIRKWVCPECGAEHDRDINAAINIRNEGLRTLTA